MYSEEELKRGLTTQVFGRKLFIYDSIDSTNALAKTFANEGAEEGTVIIADHQTAGRGRFGRTWLAESGSSLLFSIIVRPTFGTDKIGLLPFFAAVGIANAVETITGTQCECKWPNDILLKGKKCCGILMESTSQQNKFDYAIIGIGLNVNQKNFFNELEGKATSLSSECGIEFNRRNVFCQIMSSLELLYSNVSKGDFNTVLMEWKTRATIFGKRITMTQATDVIDGIAIALADDGGLVVETETYQRVFHAGDVTLAEQQ
ncbi:MAG: biotin--[acetyl-CoA-carboxylase] ligase [Bacteroidota bacterium]|jgi:BirA family biotin operon repressor/biotin-[acetyl-CoA-carboxylase] ligase